MAKSIVRLDRIKAIYNGHIESVVHNAELQNGWVVQVGGLSNGNRDLRTVVQPTAGAGALALIAAPEIVKSEYVRTDNALENFTNEAGKAIRAYNLERADIFSVTYDGLTLLATDPVVGNYVVAQAGFKLKEVAAVTTEAFVGKIIGVETLGTSTLVGENGIISRINKYVVIEVVKN